MLTPTGIRIEAKSGAYLQSRAQNKLPPIRFDIRPTRLEFAKGGTKRHAQIYVLCVLHHREQATVDPLDLSQWELYVLPTATLNRKLPLQKTLDLAELVKLSPRQVGFGELAACINGLLSNSEAT